MSYFSISLRDALYAMFRTRFDGTDDEFWSWVEHVMVMLWARIQADEYIRFPLETLKNLSATGEASGR